MSGSPVRSDPLREYVETRSPEAFRRVVEGHIDAVFSQCRRQLRDADRAQEATQLVFVTLARRAHELSPTVLLGGWLFKTARYVCARERRTERRRLARERRAAEMKHEMIGRTPAVPPLVTNGAAPNVRPSDGLPDDSILTAFWPAWYNASVLGYFSPDGSLDTHPAPPLQARGFFVGRIMSHSPILLAIVLGIGGLRFLFQPNYAERWAEFQR